jgi:hypothetical protein
MSNISTLPGSGGGGGVTSITGNSGGALTGAVTITGGTSGATYAGSGGNTLTTSFNFLALPNTSGVGSVGQIRFGGARFISNFGTGNVFVGSGAGNTTLTGPFNIGIGFDAGSSLTSGNSNVAIGELACTAVTTGSNNIALGQGALDTITTGSDNIALGIEAGDGATTSNNCIYLGNNTNGSSVDGVTIIGASGTQVKCFIAGVRGVTTTNNDAIAVLIDSAGQIGTVSSSARYKENIVDMGSDTDRLMQLRPVIFSMKSDESKTKRYGLIAEEVAQVFPELVVYKDEEPETVRYHDLAVMLLNEFQKLKKQMENK